MLRSVPCKVPLTQQFAVSGTPWSFPALYRGLDLPMGVSCAASHYASQQQWGAHAQRVHRYRNAAARLSKGRRCNACGSVYASASRLKNHLLYSARCRQFLEAAPDTAHAASLTGAGHVQAPVVCRGVGRALPSVEGPLLCRDLLVSLRALTSAEDQDIYDIVASHVEPLPVLRATVETWVRGLPEGTLASAGSDVLLVLHPEPLVLSCMWQAARSAPACCVRPTHRCACSQASLCWSSRVSLRTLGL